MIDREVYEIKIIFLGETGVGKTNLINICCDIEFKKETESSFSSSIIEKKIFINNIPYLLKFWDTAGQEKYHSLNKILIKDSSICIFVYDVSIPETFNSLNYWIKTAKDILKDNIILGLVANKMDLEEKVKGEEGRNLAEEIDAFFFESSAKNDKGEFKFFIKKLVNEFLNKNALNEWEIFTKLDEDKFSLSVDKINDMQEKKCC